MISKVFWAVSVVGLLAGVSSARADVYNFSYSGANQYGAVGGSGSFTTGTPYGDGYVPLTSISGTTLEGGTIKGLDGEIGQHYSDSSSANIGVDPPSYVIDWNTAMGFDNAFLPAGVASGSPFTVWGLSFIVTGPSWYVQTGYIPAVTLFSQGGQTYEGDYAVGGNSGVVPVTFSATLASAPEPGFYGVLALGLGGLGIFISRRKNAPIK